MRSAGALQSGQVGSSASHSHLRMQGPGEGEGEGWGQGWGEGWGAGWGEGLSEDWVGAAALLRCWVGDKVRLLRTDRGTRGRTATGRAYLPPPVRPSRCCTPAHFRAPLPRRPPLSGQWCALGARRWRPRAGAATRAHAAAPRPRASSRSGCRRCPSVSRETRRHRARAPAPGVSSPARTVDAAASGGGRHSG